MVKPRTDTTDSRAVSLVVTTRNDDHGRNMLHRLQTFVDALLQQANRHSLHGELIIVEWNPPPGPRIHEVLNLRTESEIFAIRFIEVPLEAHQTIRNSDVIPLFQMIAKNVGVRRAKGKFVLATNPDLLFSDSLISFLASGQLRSDHLYRIDRHDVAADIPMDASLDEQLRWCTANVLRIHRRRGTFYPGRQMLARLRNINLARKLKLIGKKWNEIHAPWTAVFSVLKQISLTRTLEKCARIFYSPRRLARRALWVSLRFTDPLPKVHTNGCGDFTLMAKDRWLALRGYPELPIWSMHIDSLLCYMAVASGLRETVLRPPAKIFHIEHYDSWVVMTPDDRLRTFARKPWIDIGLLNDLWENMYRTNRPVRFNNENWGLAHWPLDEVVIVSGQKYCSRNEGKTTEIAVAAR